MRQALALLLLAPMMFYAWMLSVAGGVALYGLLRSAVIREVADTSLLCWRAGEVVSLRGLLSGGWSDLLDSRTRNAAGEEVVSLRKSRHALHFSSSLLVTGVTMTAKGAKLYSTFCNGSHNSRLLKRLYRDEMSDLGSRWRDHLTSL